MQLSRPPDEVLDNRFFHVTGIVMVVATLLAGAIILRLANDGAALGFQEPVAV